MWLANGRLFDGTGAAPRERVSVLVEDGRIAAIADAAEAAPEGARFVELGGRMLTVGIHSRWTGQPNRAAPLRRFIEYVQAQDDVCFMRRVDIAQFWIDTFG